MRNTGFRREVGVQRVREIRREYRKDVRITPNGRISKQIWIVEGLRDNLVNGGGIQYLHKEGEAEINV